jgi:hypothetical protein
MRRVFSSIVVVGGVVGASLGFASAPAFAAPTKVCTIDDIRTNELSGLIATKSGYVAINDGTDVSSHDQVFFLSSKCKVSKTVPYTGNGSADPEDLALSPDGKTLWVADIGDNADAATRRSSIALWSLAADGSSKPVLHRLAYPGNKPHDAEALLIGADGTPYIVTKTGAATSEIYRPTGPLQKDNATGVPLEKAGDITLPKSTTDNLLKATGRLMITGAARSPDGTRIALRTYADAFEWDVPDGDIVKALTTGKPRMTPLADAFGESIAYTPDGKSFLTVSDIGQLPQGTEVMIQSYTPSTQAVVAESVAGPGGSASQSGSGKSWTASLTLQDITYLIAAVGVVGALLVGLGIFGIVRARRKRGAEPLDLFDPDDGDAMRSGRPGPVDNSLDQPAPARGTTYGAGGGWTEPAGGPGGDFEPVARPAGAVYGGQPTGGAVYGGGATGRPPAGGGAVYGGPGAGAGAGAGAQPGGVPGPVYGGGRGGPANGDGRAPGDGRRNGPPANGQGGPRPDQYGRGGPGAPVDGYPGNGYPDNGYR